MEWAHRASDTLFWDAAFGQNAPKNHYSISQKTTSNEDVVFVKEEKNGENNGASWTLYCICDGHAGVEAALLIKKHLWTSLRNRLPKTKPDRTHGFASWAAEIRQAIRHAFAELDEEFSAQCDDCDSGSTLTIALSCGWFLTVANVGDSEAVIDTGVSVDVVTDSHRLEECEKEINRLKEAGVTVARLGRDLRSPAKQGDIGLGPQRSWPGGLANSRSIGDLEGGRHIVASPHIKQCILPKKGCRLIMGSDGLWDMVDHQTAGIVTRANSNKTSAGRLVTLAVYRNDWVVHDDITVLVIDFQPEGGQEFDQICKGLRRRKKRGSPFACFCASEVDEPETEDHLLTHVATVDCVLDPAGTIYASLDKTNDATMTEGSSSVEL